MKVSVSFFYTNGDFQNVNVVVCDKNDKPTHQMCSKTVKEAFSAIIETKYHEQDNHLNIVKQIDTETTELQRILEVFSNERTIKW